MKTVILAGGMGTRLSEETDLKPKPLVEIGGDPIIWHIMQHYAHFGHTEFVVALGYKGDLLKRYFVDRCQLGGSLTVALMNGTIESGDTPVLDWTVSLMETGIKTQTGGRLRRLAPAIGAKPFMLTYGDGVCNVDLNRLLEYHRSHGKLATVTAVHPPARFGSIHMEQGVVTSFSEKSPVHEGWINGGFMVMEPGVFGYLSQDEDSLEVVLLERLARDRQLVAYQHEGFWHCMDTLRDVRELERLFQLGNPPWQSW